MRHCCCFMAFQVSHLPKMKSQRRRLCAITVLFHCWPSTLCIYERSMLPSSPDTITQTRPFSDSQMFFNTESIIALVSLIVTIPPTLLVLYQCVKRRRRSSFGTNQSFAFDGLPEAYHTNTSTFRRPEVLFLTRTDTMITLGTIPPRGFYDPGSLRQHIAESPWTIPHSQ
ncbi:hypothetical protein IWZ01DRAFT_112501 [Phyllosticta capitalensis]